MWVFLENLGWYSLLERYATYFYYLYKARRFYYLTRTIGYIKTAPSSVLWPPIAARTVQSTIFFTILFYCSIRSQDKNRFTSELYNDIYFKIK